MTTKALGSSYVINRTVKLSLDNAGPPPAHWVQYTSMGLRPSPHGLLQLDLVLLESIHLPALDIILFKN